MLSKSGSSTFDGYNKWDFAGSGAYDKPTTQSNGYSKASAVVTESAHNNSYYSGTDVWSDNTWVYQWEKWGDSANDRAYTLLTSYSNTSTYNQDGYDNSSVSYGNGSYQEENHSVGEFEESYVCQVSTYMAIVIPLNPELSVRLG